MVIVLIIILTVAVVYLFLRLRKLEKTTPKVETNNKGGYHLTFNNDIIYNANPK